VPTALNVDGLDSERAKWGKWARRYLRLTERAAPLLASATITDSRTVQALYRSWGWETLYIPYGSELDSHDEESDEPDDTLERLGLSPGGYILFVGRLVPENNAHVLVEAFRGLDTDLKLAVVGDAPYADDYQERLHNAGDDRVVFAGYQFGRAYRTLLRNAVLLGVPTEVGGTHPVILEALGAGTCIVVNDHTPNLETVGGAGLSYSGSQGATDLRRVLKSLLADPEAIERYRTAALERSRVYSWDAVTDAYERLAEQLVARKRRQRGT
jgi:glycosyltransferase involved in cell wall biosynthesis